MTHFLKHDQINELGTKLSFEIKALQILLTHQVKTERLVDNFIPDQFDRATIEEERNNNRMLNHRNTMQLTKLKHTQYRLNCVTKDFGYCSCGDEIDFRRLIGVLTTILCAECQRRLEIRSKINNGNYNPLDSNNKCIT